MKNSITLVIGSTGKTGRRIARDLRQRGRTVRDGSRTSAPGFDWEKPETWKAALQGIDSAYVSFFPDLAMDGAPETVAEFTEQARRAGLRRLVLLSGRGEANAERAEQVVRASGLEFTLVRASWFSQNFSEGNLLGSVMQGLVAMPAGTVAEPFVDVDDVSDVAVAALTEERHVGQLYEVTGPRLLSFGQAAAEIAAASGRPVHYLDVPFEAFEAALTEQAGPDFAALFTGLCREVLDGRNASTCDGVERALGRAPRDFVDFCRATAAAGVWQ